MVIIFSDINDYSTTKVMQYLRYWNEPVLRLNREDMPECRYLLSLSNNEKTEIEIQIFERKIRLEDIKSIWFRRDAFRFLLKGENPAERSYFTRQLNRYLHIEQQTLNTFIYEQILSSGIRVLGNPFRYNVQKLTVLKKAIECGLRIPDTLITSNRIDIEGFLSEKESLVTKAIQDNFSPITTHSGYGLLTESIDNSIISELPKTFYPSLFQKKIEKKYEVRLFYIDGSFYSIAIHSQQNQKTQVDYRNYDSSNPNRIDLIRVPNTILRKLKKLMDRLQLNTGSIDMIYTIDNQYIFLEVNPVGQYDMVGYATNLQLDKKIATWLSKRQS